MRYSDIIVIIICYTRSLEELVEIEDHIWDYVGDYSKIEFKCMLDAIEVKLNVIKEKKYT